MNHRMPRHSTVVHYGLACLCLVCIAGSSLGAETVRIVCDAAAVPRVKYGVDRLAEAMQEAAIDAAVTDASSPVPKGTTQIVVGTAQQADIQSLIEAGQVTLPEGGLRPEGFLLATCADGTLAVVGADDSGALYGCLELAGRVRRAGKLPAKLNFSDAPALKLRGTCVAMQKPYILPGRHVYEYPYTPELFPFFYDKAYWQEYLDYLADNRMNSLYLWNGHPFASLVKLPDYPYALEVSEETYQKNVEMFRYITKEADKRGIWVVQMFYNIILSKPFAEHNGLSTQLRAPTPIAADYTRKSIAEFVHQYPHVGLLVCLGEALQNIPMQVKWCTEVILPGVKDGMREAGLTEEPPIVIRTHATDPAVVMPEALKVYGNLYTEAKYNGESLTTWEPRGVWQQIHLAMSRLGSTHIANVHILSNLEPFRYGAQRFIQKSVQAMRDRLGAGGLHLYPLAYWNWPDSPDKTNPPLKQYKRDWIWFEAWGRYAWNPDIDAATDRAYWIGRLTDVYGSPKAAALILDAYNDSGECAPMLVRRFGITEGNRQTLSLGMTLDQLVDPDKYGPYPELWLSQAPPGERLQEYADREWSHRPHEGETPPQVVAEVLDYSAKAVAAVDAAAPLVTKNVAEFQRLRNDVHCIRAMCENYAAKVNAAMLVLRYRHSGDPADMDQAARYLAESLDHYRKLVELTDDTYLFANSMQTQQRRIPVRGGVGRESANYLWSQVLPVYEDELARFQQAVADLRAGKPGAVFQLKPLRKASFEVRSRNAEKYVVETGARVFTDQPFEIRSLAPELSGLKGIRFSHAAAKAGRYEPVEFETDEPVDILIGYVQSKDDGWLRVPQLETDALAAERGETEVLIENAAVVDSLPKIDVYTLRFGKGRHKLEVRGSGSFVVLGVVAADDHRP
jgi:hypothetical protein